MIEVKEELYIRLLYFYILDLEKQIKYWNVELFRHDEDPIEYLHQLKEELQELPDIPFHNMTKRKHKLLHRVEKLITKSS